MATAGEWEKINGVKLSQPILDTLTDDLKFTTMTPVQAATIPLFMRNKDVAVEACTGSGKTLAFLIPILEIIMRREDPLKKHEIGAIVITPIRELAVQINEVLQPFLAKINVSSASPLASLLLTGGGSDIQEDVTKFREGGANIVIATPGRLEYMLEYKDFKVKELEVLVLDEADRLLDMGFEKSLNTILASLPKQRRTGLFSATQTSQVVELVRAGLRNPVNVAVKVENKSTHSVQKTPNQLENLFTTCDSDEKLSQLISFLRAKQDKKVIVYFLTCASVTFYWRVIHGLQLVKTPVFSLHGKVPQNKRTATYQKFVNSKNGVLLSTDVASRGLDIPDVDWIVQFDPPQSPDTFIHRVGRTARMGKEGAALVYLLPSEDTYKEFLTVKKVPISERPKENAEDILLNVHKFVTADKETYDKAQVAFVSYIRAYKEHQLSYIFRLNKIDIGKLARAFCLIQLPRMPELKTIKNIEFVPDSQIDVNSIKYTDSAREAKRLKVLALREKKQKKQSRKEKHREAKNNNNNNSNPKNQKMKEDDDSEDDMEELFKEASLMKKLKKGKISKKEFESEMGEDDSDNDNDKNEDVEENDNDDESEEDEDEDQPKDNFRKRKVNTTSWSKNLKKKEVKKKRKEKKQKINSYKKQ